ncbi:hypothetical protein SADUNF_Sadunf10G0009700 [Salix dunnii]|uniref:Apple domain-containing protein n=1 Tax=Salix dunnii TaxID=1413687 RepID=A0A835JRK5_9ROSI|nr:hypothetical protein SADUNF_Sadunf10G0009700 [Salix dunnii]
MKLGRNIKTGMDWYMTSWKSPDDPSRGNITGILVPDGYPELILLEDSKVMHRTGPWNGVQFSGMPQIKPNPVYMFEFVYNDKEIFYREQLHDSSRHWRSLLTENGDAQHLLWIERTQNWFLYETANTDYCEKYALCGANGFCSINNSPVCSCLNGFVPKVPRDWDKTDWSSGCVRKTALNCSRDGFMKLSGVKMPETRNSWFNRSMDLEECKNTCLKNCSCTAYTNLDVRDGGSGCLLWFNDLIDIRTFIQNQQEIYIRLAASELDNGDSAKVNTKSKVKKRIVATTVFSAGILFIGLCLVLYVLKKKQKKNSDLQRRSNDNNLKEELELPLFNIDELACASDNFSASNKLGEGGFGPVYKAWILFKQGRSLELAAKSKVEACHMSEAMRSIHVGLLCVQENTEDRPDISHVVLMLGDEKELPQPQQPGFFTGRDLFELSYSSSQSKPPSANECSISMLEAR